MKLTEKGLKITKGRRTFWSDLLTITIKHLLMDTRLYHLSRKLSRLLRHGDKNVSIMPDGYIFVDDLLKIKSFAGYTFDDISKVVETNDKKRFVLVKEVSGKWKIKACQGHSVEVPDLSLVPISSDEDAPIVIHGTSKEAWKLIENTGLSRMTRQYIHFCPGLPQSKEVISGFRPSSKVLIYIDVEKAIRDGIKFFRSENNVILSPGDEGGYIRPQYFKNVIFLQ